MDSSSPQQLTPKQKLRLAAGVFAIYWPLRFYVNLETFHWENFGPFYAVIWLLEIPIIIALFTFWLSLMEWLENRLSPQQGQQIRLNSKLSVQLATLLIAGTLSVGFDWAFFGFLHQARTVFDQTQPMGGSVQSAPARTPGRERIGQSYRQQRRKATTALTVMALLMAFYVAANRRGDTLVAHLQVNAEQLKREASQAQFDALKNQVNPHFLFNSLSILSALVAVNPNLSIRFINHLAQAYRYILEQRDSQRVRLKTELEFLETYCFLLNIRFDGKLQVTNAISEEHALRFSIAPLTLQLLMENAVKHNQMSTERPLLVSLTIEHDYLLFRNPIQSRLPDETLTPPSTGVGLANITNRYRLLTDRPVRVSQSATTFVVSIPLLA